jgi:type VI secretion system ImpM family protein
MSFLFSAPAASRSAPVMAMGKIPSFPEFLQARTSREPEQSFDAWLEAGMELASSKYGPAWGEAFGAGDVRGFVWRAPREARTDAILCGVLIPSHDSVGRHYPLAIATAVPMQAVARAPHVVPLAFGDFLESAYEAAADLAVIAPADLKARLAELRPPGEPDIERAAAEYDAWSSTARIDGAWGAVFDERPFESSITVIQAARRAVEAVRGVEAPPSGLNLLLPLGQGGPASAALWLDIVRRLCGWKTTIPSTFWAVSEGAMLIALGDAPPSTLGTLWLPDTTNPNVCDLDAMQYEALVSSRSPDSRLRAALDPTVAPDAPMIDLLTTLSH